MTSTAARLLLVLALLVTTGCAAHHHAPALQPTLLGAAPPGGLVQVGNGDWVLVGIYAFVGAVIVLGFLVDLILLPFSYDEPELFFPCCKSLLKLAH